MRRVLLVLLALLVLAVSALRAMAWLLLGPRLDRFTCSELERVQVEKLEQALELYKLDNGIYPTTEQGLQALIAEPTLEPHPPRYNPGGYVQQADLEDCSGDDFHYLEPGTHNRWSFDLCSAGWDGRLAFGESGSDDVCNWTRPGRR